MDSLNNVRNLALRAAYEAEGIGVEKHAFDVNHPVVGETRAINVGASMALMPEYLVVSGWVGADKKTEFYPVSQWGRDSARFDFQQKYYAAGVRGVTVKPLYDLERWH